MPTRKRNSIRSRRLTRTVEALERRDLLAADPIISEFQTSNSETLLDGHGNSPDWIELFNAGDESANLSEYWLTDDPDEPTKWQFPANTDLGAGEYLVVFASDLNEPDPEGNLHTNFRLGANGEYVGLIGPGGTAVSEFGADGSEYPKQFRDTSYGIGSASPPAEFVAGDSPVQYLVPTSNSLGTQWTSPDFSPGAEWTTADNGLGFAAPDDGTLLKLDFNHDASNESGADDVEQGWQAFTLADSGSTIDGIGITLTDVGGIPLLSRDRPGPTDTPPDFTLDQVYDDFIFGSSQTDGSGLRVLLENLEPGQFYDVTLWSYDSGSIGTRVSNWTEVSGDVPVVIESSYDFNSSQAPTSNLDHTMTARLRASAQGTLDIQGTRNGGTSFGVYLNGLQVSVPTAAELIQTNIQSEMTGQTSSFVRYPFTSDRSQLDTLHFDVNYDSGFVAYLNGVEVARRNLAGAPGTPVSYDAMASEERPGDAVRIAESIDLSEHTDLLVAGENVLSIHAANSSVDDDDFLIYATLTGTASGPQNLYFAEPTPGEANVSGGFLGFVEDTAFSVDRGFYTEPFELEISTPTPGATLVYTTDGSIPTSTNGVRVEPSLPTEAPVARVPIARTSYVRAFAFKDEFLSTNVDTQSYFFLEQVIAQDPLNDPDAPNYPTVWQANASADFEMDQEVVAQWNDNNPDNSDFGIREALTSIPTMSIVMEHDDLWAVSDGIYRNSDRRGERYRRAASLEYFDPATGEEFQVDAGLQIHGGASRDNVRLKKHSFRVLFRNDFGEGTLDFPLFDETDNTEFNTLVLRAFFTDSFATRSVTERYNPIESQYLRDVWMKDSLAAMGQTSTHNTYVHLYINGLYWGLYNPAERPDEAFLATYLGGEREDWDVVKDFNELFSGSKDAWNDMFALTRDMASAEDPEAIYFQLQGRNPDGTRNESLPVYLDMDSLADFMILHLYAGVEDWPHHNWYAARNRTDDEGYQFFVWDQEIGVDPRFRDRTEVGTAADHRFTPAELYHLLRTHSAEFRQLYADRVHKHLFNDGALTVENSRTRWTARAEEIEKAIVAESARWGDAREGERIRIQAGTPTVTVPTMTVNEWRDERDKILNDYMPAIHRLFLERSAEIDLTGDASAPDFNQFGGVVDAGFQLTMSAPQDPLLITNDILPEGGAVRALVPRDGSLDSSNPDVAPVWTQPDFDDSGWLSGNGGVGFDSRDDYHPLIGIDLKGGNIPVELSIDANGDGDEDNSVVFTRFLFDLDADFDPSQFDQLMLKLKFDDGVVAYLNGTRIINLDANVEAVWNDTATGANEANVAVFDEFDVTQHLELLQAGTTNVLAIYLVNRTVSSSDLLISAALSVGRFQDVGLAPIYYTLDGSDPRSPGGEINPGARLYEGPITIDRSAPVRARALAESLWSPETTTEIQVAPTTLAVTEIHYNPAAPTAEELVAFPAGERGDLEFIELHNAHPTDPLNLLGLQFTAGVDFAFGDEALAPNEYAVIVSNEIMFRARYGEGPRVIGQYEGRLNDGGETLRIDKVDGTVALQFEYGESDPWSQRADGVGASLELIDVATPLFDYSRAQRWMGSTVAGGTPGAVRQQAVGIVVNELLSRTDADNGGLDAIELYNTTSQPIEIGGWYLSDSSDELRKYQIPAGTTIPANGYWVVDATQFNPSPDNPLPNHFGLNGAGMDDVWLTRPIGEQLEFVDEVHFRASKAGESWGRVPNGEGRLTTIASPTMGGENARARVGPLLISEFMYAPLPPSAAALAIEANLERADLEFVEVFNPTAVAVDLTGWEIDGGIDYRFDPNTPLDAQAVVLIVPFNPTRPDNVLRTAAFRAHYGIGEEVVLVGGYDRQLGNEGELLQLLSSDPTLGTQNTVLEDEVIYSHRAPWPDANANSLSLQRIDVARPGYDASQWQAAPPSPGVASLASGDFDLDGDGVVSVHDVDLVCSAVAAGGQGFDLNGDNVTDASDVAILLSAGLGSRAGDLNLDGVFNSSDLVIAFQLGEYEDATNGNSLWSEGDWDCDGDFTTADFVFALQLGGYSTAAMPQAVGTHNAIVSDSAKVTPLSGILNVVGAVVDQLFADGEESIEKKQ